MLDGFHAKDHVINLFLAGLALRNDIEGLIKHFVIFLEQGAIDDVFVFQVRELRLHDIRGFNQADVFLLRQNIKSLGFKIWSDNDFHEHGVDSFSDVGCYGAVDGDDATKDRHIITGNHFVKSDVDIVVAGDAGGGCCASRQPRRGGQIL